MPERHRLLTLVESKGARIRVVRGRIWIAEDGVMHEEVLVEGAEYVVAGDGRVIVLQETVDRQGAMTEIAVTLAGELPPAWKAALEWPQAGCAGGSSADSSR